MSSPDITNYSYFETYFNNGRSKNQTYAYTYICIYIYWPYLSLDQSHMPTPTTPIKIELIVGTTLLFKISSEG